ncbi:MAG TPA: rod shape-determining protein MreC [Solimonas sp.]|nr:rod shape-determining protein MreC [Solimonas sp.]
MNSLQDTYRKPLFPRGPGLGARTFFLALCASALIFNDYRGDSLKQVRAWGTVLVSPITWLASLPFNLVSAAEHIDTRATLEAENAELRRKQLLLDAKLQKYEALEAENHRIRELLASASELEEHVLIAEIIALSQDPYRHQITLNKGTRDGVYRGQALVDAHGVMGQIVEVGPATAVALLITYPDHGIPVEVNRTGLQTIAIGRGDGRGLRLPFLPSNADIKVGDQLVSSALGGRFPAGYPVAEVYEINHVAGEHFMEAFAYPTARLNQGRQALLVWSESFPLPEPGEAPAAPPPKADAARRPQ